MKGKEKIVVIGGGASGFFAAINIADLNPEAEVTIVEKSSKLLSKVKVSGGGRCNVTHACFDPRDLSENYPRGEKELLGPLNHFGVGDIIEWFDQRGIELKVEEDGRMFPVSNSSQSIIDCFLNEANKLGIKIKMSTEVLSVKKTNNFKLHCKDGIIEANKIVVGIGGNSKEKHYEFLKELGLSIIAPIPSLFTFNLPKHPSNQLMGLSINATVKLIGTEFEEYGPLLFTHWGMSGPAILKLSAKAAKHLYLKSYQFDFTVCWIDNAQSFIEEQRKRYGNKLVWKTSLPDIPKRLWTYFIDRVSIDSDKNWADLNKEEVETLEQVLSSDLYTANGKTTFKEEFVTCGGIELSQVNMKTMESKNLEGLFFCGEVLDIDAVTGGFNFQAAWTTSYRAALAISGN